MAARLRIVLFSPERQFANVDAMSRRPHVLRAFLYLFLVVVQSASDDSVRLSEGLGGRHGTEFSDEASVSAGQIIGSVTIRANKQVDGVSLEILGPRATTFIHGGSGGEEHVLKLGDQEHITSMEAHWGERNGRTRIFYLSFVTSAENVVAAGSKTTDMQTITAPEGFQLGGFFGRGGDEIDMLGVVWSRISADASVEEARAVMSPAISALESLVATKSGVSSTRSLETSTEESTDGPLSGSLVPTESTSDSSSGSVDLAESAGEPLWGSVDPEKSTDGGVAGSTDDMEVTSLQTVQEDLSAVGFDPSTASGEVMAAGDAASSSTTGSKQVSLDATAVGLTEHSAPVFVEDLVAASEEGSAAGDIRSSLADSTEAPDATSTEGSKVSFDETSVAALGAVALAAKDTSSSQAESTEALDVTSTEGSGFTLDETSAATSEENSVAGDASSSLAESMEASDARSAEGSGVSSVAMPEANAMAGSSSADTAVPPVESVAPLGPVMAVKDSIVLSESFGGPHGRDFSDKNLVNSGQTVKAISIYANKRLDGISLSISAPKTLTFTHGGTGGNRQELVLGKDEYVNSMEVHRGKKDGHTRIFYVSFLTSAGRALSGGSVTDDKLTVTAPEGFQLAGFFGKDGKEIDALGAVWAFIELVKPAPVPVPVSIPAEDLPGTVSPVDIAGSLSEVKAKVNEQAVQLSDSFGGPHGEQFSDHLAVTSGMTITSVTIRAGKRVDGLTVQVSAPKEMTFTHGGRNGKEHTMVLEPGEYITSMEAHWGQKSGHTRIFFLSLGTSKGNVLSGGSQTTEKGSVTAPKGYQLAGFFGRYGDEMDLIGAVWSSIALMNETVSTPVSADDDIALSQLFGGPHGNAFSDIQKIKFGQTVSAITIRANLRLDAVTVQISAPAELTLNHGDHGGTEKTLALGPDEVITSVEVHWAKKSKHTAVFYVCFTTSANNTLAGGTKTDNRGTATPPEGFVFSGLYGRADNGVDQLGVIWTRKTAKNLLLTDPSGVGNNTYGTTIRNWVGPAIGKAGDTACYRKSVNFDSNNICPLGYDKDDTECVVQCPMAFPVKCGLECIPQNDDCALAVMQKIGAAVTVAINLATGNLLGTLKAIYKTTRWAALCVLNMVNVIRGLIYYLRYRQTTGPVGDTAEILTAAYQTDLVVYDLPVAICTCLGIEVPKTFKFMSYVLVIVEGIVKQAITNGDTIISSAENVMKLLTGTGVANKSRTTVDELEDLVAKNTSCGWNLKRLTDRVTRAVLRYRNVSTSVADLRVKVYETPIVLNDIPVITNNCMGELLAAKTMAMAYETRDLIRRTFGVIVDQLIEKGKTDNGKDVAEDEYALEVANMGLVVLSCVDPSGIAYLTSQLVQPVCGPTAYLGEIDDGTLYDALGMTLMDEAFIGSYGSYTHAGDGVIHLVFESVDTKDVTVVIHSGGEEYGEVDVGAGDIVVWDATFPELEDKTMYLDRWRPGLLGLPGSGGGSLLLWIPRSSEGGHITLHVRINPS
uniref:Jacalin-type lectin domain-containing protein n=1 Tax=Peronospora matthiolae TaxID=2874970 RepID=A0AAV1V3L6_9STRA